MTSAFATAAAPTGPTPVRQNADVTVAPLLPDLHQPRRHALRAHGLTPMESGVLAYLNHNTGEPNIDPDPPRRADGHRSIAYKPTESSDWSAWVSSTGQINPETAARTSCELTSAGERLRCALAADLQRRTTEDSRRASPRRARPAPRPADAVVEGNRILARPGAGRRKRTAPISSNQAGERYA